MMALSLLPLWLFMYVRSVTEPPEVATGPLGVGAEEYRNCASCHGSAGEGGVGRQLDEGEVLKTFPHIEDQLRFVYFGTANYNLAGVASYGNPDREGGPHIAGSFGPMPAWGETGRRRADRRRDPRRRLPRALHDQRRGPDRGEHGEGVQGLVLRGVPDLRRPARRARTLADARHDADRRQREPADRDHPHRRQAGRGLAALTVTVEPGGLAGPAASTITTDVLVVGGGPAGAAAAYWLARHGHDVTVVEKKTFPREKTCGDGLTPRAVKQLADMGLEPRAQPVPPLPGPAGDGDGPRARARRGRRTRCTRRTATSCAGASSTRFVAANAARAGATILEGHEAVHPLIERGFVRGASVQRPDGSTVDVRAEFTIVADGANSRFGRALGTFRTREWPYGTAIRTYWRSPKHAEPWIESALDVKDRNGNPMPGYGWIFPVGDGTVNIGVGLLSTFRDFKSVNTTHLLDAYAHQIADRWEIDAAHPEGRPVSGRIPMGGSVGPKAGPTHLVVGDAAGSVNPFNGEGIDYAYETGRLAADVIHEALTDADPTALQRYPKLLRGRVRPVLQGRPPVRPGHRPPGADARADAHRHAQPHADGVGAADHGQPAAPRRARPGRGRLQGGVGDRAPRAERVAQSGQDPLRSRSSARTPSTSVVRGRHRCSQRSCSRGERSRYAPSVRPHWVRHRSGQMT